MTFFLTSIADIWCFLDLPAGFPFKAGADTVAFMAGTAEGIADDQLATCVRFFTVIPVDTEVVRIVETSFIPGIYDPAFPDFF